MFSREILKTAGQVCRRKVFVFAQNSSPPSVQHFSTSAILCRSKFRHSREYIPVLHELWRRREQVGPERPKHRSELPNWNYDAELFGFCKRLGEEWKRETLIEAFTERAYAEEEQKRRYKLTSTQSEDVDGAQLSEIAVPYNVKLAGQGEKICVNYITAFLCHSLPNYPEDGVKAVCEFLMTDDLLGHVCKNIGTGDLVLTTDFPPTVKVYANVLKALVGGLSRDQGADKAHAFVHDFVVTQLSGRDINQFWKITNPMGLLADMMKKPVDQGGAGVEGEPEPRIIWQTGASTPLAAYKVGIYDSTSKKLLGTGGGETAAIAEQMAALDSLYRIFGTTDWRLPFAFGKQAHTLKLSN